MSVAGQSDDNLQWARSKDRMLSLIALNYRVRTPEGELAQPEQFREDFEQRFEDCASLDALWRMLGEPHQSAVRKMVEHPSVEVDLGHGKSWKYYDQRLLAYLDRGEKVALPETGLAPRYGHQSIQKSENK